MSGWNGSDRRGNTAPVQPKVAAKKPSPIRGIVAGLLVVAVSAIACFVFFSGSEKPQTEKAEKERGRIKEVSPSSAPTNKVETASTNDQKTAKKHDYRYDVPEGSYRAANGRLYTPTGRRILERPPARHIKLYDDKKPRVFKHMAENEILRLVSQRGGLMPLPSYYGVAFEKSFQESLKTEIEIYPTDSEDVQQKKRDMIEIKKELAERVAAGESVCDIMRKTQEEFKQLALYKKDLIKNAKEIVESHDLTEQEINDYTEAANKILKERGAEPISSKMLHVYRAKYLNSQNNGAKPQNEGTKEK